MAEVLFEIPEWLDYADYDNYPTQANPTTNADFVNYMTNQNKLVGALTGVFLWQPNTNFTAGKIIVSPNMPEGMEAVALTGGFTGTVEPAWKSDIAEYQDSGVKWQLRYRHWSKDVVPIANGGTGATNAQTARVNLSTNIKTYTTFGQLGFSSVPTLIELLNSMPSESQFVFYVNISQSSNWNLPGAGIIKITKAQYIDYASLQLQRYGGDSNVVRKMWYENWSRGQTQLYWKEIFAENKISTQAQAEAGIDNTTVMTPLQTKNAIDSQRPIATQAQAEAGIDNTTVMTPLQTKNAIDARNFALNGVLSMPSFQTNAIAINIETLTGDGYVIPCDGYVSFGAYGADSFASWVRLYTTQKDYLAISAYVQQQHNFRGLLPVAKGAGVKLQHGEGATVTECYFYPAESEV